MTLLFFVSELLVWNRHLRDEDKGRRGGVEFGDQCLEVYTTKWGGCDTCRGPQALWQGKPQWMVRWRSRTDQPSTTHITRRPPHHLRSGPGWVLEALSTHGPRQGHSHGKGVQVCVAHPGPCFYWRGFHPQHGWLPRQQVMMVGYGPTHIMGMGLSIGKHLHCAMAIRMVEGYMGCVRGAMPLLRSAGWMHTIAQADVHNWGLQAWHAAGGLDGDNKFYKL